MAPQLVFGGGGIGGTEKSFTFAFDTKEKVSILLKDLRELGFEAIDSAASYPPSNPWDTERLLGETKAALPDVGGFIIDSKVEGVYPPKPMLDDAHIEESLDKTLELLGVNKIRTLYAHAPDAVVPLEVTAKAFHRQYELGKFEQLGLCGYDTDSLREYFAICDANGYIKPTVYQNLYNVLCREDEGEKMDLLRRNHCVYYAFSPLAGGFLTGKVTMALDTGNNSELERTRWQGDSTHPNYPPRFDRPAMHSAMRRLMGACENASPPLTVTEASLRWLMHHSALREGDAIILGASKVHQLRSNVNEAKRGPLPEEIRKVLDGLNAMAEEQTN